MAINLRPFRTTTFRLSALYSFLFALSAAALMYYIYYSTVGLLERQNEETIMAQVEGLSEQFNTGGPEALEQAINHRLAEKSNEVYMLADAKGQYIAGNLHSPPINDLPDNAWVDFSIQKTDADVPVGHSARGFNVQLPEDYQLIVGLDVQDLRQFGKVMRRAVLWGVGLATLLGLASGFLFSRNLLRRIDGITASSLRIMSGDFSGRMPVSGSGDEMDRLSQSLNEMLSRIENLMVGMREVSSNVAHDLRTPLTRLRARIEGALRQNTKKEFEAALQQGLADSESLLATFNALLSINQVESGQLRSSLEVLDAHAVLADVVDLYEPLAEDQNGALTLASAAGLVVRGRKELLAQAVSNLLDNAIKYGASSDGTVAITVTGERRPGEVVITVADRGQGVPAADRERVLQRFVRLDASRSRPGNGLGLSLVSSVASFHGGKLILGDNQPGLKAEIHLPMASGA